MTCICSGSSVTEQMFMLKIVTCSGKGPLEIKFHFPIVAKMWGKLIFFIFFYLVHNNYFTRKCRNLAS